MQPICINDLDALYIAAILVDKLLEREQGRDKIIGGTGVRPADFDDAQRRMVDLIERLQPHMGRNVLTRAQQARLYAVEAV